jgi:hypothetical protein
VPRNNIDWFLVTAVTSGASSIYQQRVLVSMYDIENIRSRDPHARLKIGLELSESR